jgi:serine/threonine protein kinase/tetratricopeptide (TPR) repeat protein
MAQVWAAVHQRLGFQAAVKVVVSELASDSHYVDAFFSEARSHAGIEHPSVIRLLDYGHVGGEDVPPPDARQGDPYLVMERAEGTLRDRMPRSYGGLVRVLLEVLDALAYAHARGVLHRDLKPENILRVGDHYKLADFGIAQSTRLDETYDRETLNPTVGTPAYMPPEQLRGATHEFGPWTDLYALGCMTFEMVSGAVPYSGSRLMQIAMAHLEEPVPTLDPRFAVPAALERWIVRLMAKRPRDRFRWAADAAHALVELSLGFDAESEAAHDSPRQRNSATQILDVAHDMTTLVDIVSDEFVSGPTVDADGLVTPHPEAESVAPRVTPIESAPAPMPAKWRERRRSVTSEAAEGLGLFALRRPCVVGQVEAREALWESLRTVRESGALECVIVRGASGAPVTEVCEWLTTRAHEVAAASTLRVFHSRAGGSREGLVGLAEDFFSLWSLGSRHVADRIESLLAGHVPQELLHAEVSALAAEVSAARGEEPENRVVPTRRDRYRMLSRAVEIATETRPAILLVENAQWGPDALAFVDYLMDRQADRPLLVVVSVLEDEVDRDSSIARALEAIAEAARPVALERYDATEQEALVDELLGLEPRSRARVVDITVGDQVFAQSLLADCIDNDWLDATEEGFRITDEADVAPDAATLFARRIERFETHVGGDVADVLEVAATLGRAPEPAELESVCAEIGLTLPQGLDGLLEEFGLVVSRGHRWWFVHDAGVEGLRQRAREDGKAAQWHRACAAVLRQRTGPDRPETLRRVAEHLEAAGDLKQSLKPRLEAAQAIRRTDAPLARRMVEQCRNHAGALKLSPDSATAIEIDCVEGQVFLSEGALEKGEALAVRAADAAERTANRPGLALALRIRARAATLRGALEEASRLYVKAERLASDLGAIDDAASAAFGAGYAAYARADYAAASEYYERAIDRYEAISRLDQAASVQSYLAGLHVATGSFDEARRASERAMETGRRIGNVNVMAEAALGLGEIARHTGSFRDAREHYREARYLFQLTGSGRRRSVNLNLALNELGQGHYAEAMKLLGSLEYKSGPRAALVMIGRATCALGTGDPDLFGEVLDEAIEMVGREARFRDFAWMLEIASSIATGVDTRLARRLDDVLLDYYRRTGDRSRQQVVRTRMEARTPS